jgi:hypothetical protein
MGRASPDFTARRRRIKTMGLAPGVAAIGVRGIEVTQTIQDLQNSVVLIAGKATAVRVYVDPTSAAAAGTITGEITWRRAGAAGAAFLPAMNSIRIDPNPNKVASLIEQRADLELSLNFLLPPEAIAAGVVEITLNRLFVPGANELALAPQQPLRLTFADAVPLRVRVIGLRYRVAGSPGGIAPNAIHFAYLKSYLTRAYPVAALEWSQIVVDADFQAPFDDSTVVLANAQVAALRSREVSSGVDPRTHYYGLVDDNNRTAFMRGRAFIIPETPQPDVVASGPCGVPNGFAGDRDASYADWYAAHELGHTFGRFHPGFPPTGQDASDPQFPYPGGLITTPDGRYMGFDIGDQALSMPMSALLGTRFHDVMTYEDNQWLSAHTYDAIFRRLVLENQQFV